MVVVFDPFLQLHELKQIQTSNLFEKRSALIFVFLFSLVLSVSTTVLTIRLEALVCISQSFP